MSVHARSGNWHYRFKVHGKTHAQSTGLAATQRNLNAAKAIEAQARLDVLAGKFQKIEGMPFATAATEFLLWCHRTQYRQKPNTAKRISGSFCSLTEFFQNHRVHEIRPGDIERFKTWRATEHRVQDVTIRSDLNALSLFFRYAISSEWRSDNPLLGQEKVKRPSGEDAVRIHVITPEEEAAYFSVAKPGSNLSDVAKLILLQGARPEEIMSLQKMFYDRSRGTIKIPGGKTRAAKRTLNLCAEAIEIVERRIQTTGDSRWLFPSDRIRGGHLQQLNNVHDRVCRDAGVSFVLYDFRHTFATRMLIEAEVDMASLAAIMGHSNMTVLRKYVHPTEEHQKEAMRKYDATRPKTQLRKVKG